MQEIDDELRVYKNGDLLFSKKVKLKPLEIFTTNVDDTDTDEIKVVLGKNKLVYSSNKKEVLVDRPLKPNKDFSWESAYGLFVKGQELEKQREYVGAKNAYEKALEKDAGFLPAINRLALSFYRQMKYDEALSLVKKALAIDTYDGEANYLLGLISREIDDFTTSKSGFSIAMGAVAFRSSAATELANLFLIEKDWVKAKKYAIKALNFNQQNLDALQIMAIVNRNSGNIDEAREVLSRIAELDGTNHFQRFESFLISENTDDQELFMKGITNELPHETFLDLAINYSKKGCTEEAIKVLELAPKNPIVDLLLADLNPDKKEAYIKNAMSQSVEYIFPHRVETAKVLKSILTEQSHWKLRYYLGLILWNKNLISEAKEQFLACGDEPDFSAFYLAKSKLVETENDKLKALQKANELTPDDWRSALALANYYISDKQVEKAHKLIKPFVTKYPEQSAIGLFYAQTMGAKHDFKDAISFLENYELLPFEGATIGRDLYNEVCVRTAFSALKNKKYKEAINFAEKAKLFPKNLGVGRPYDVDERLENFILAKAYELKGDKKNAKQFAAKIMDYSHPIYKEENTRLFLQLDLLIENGKNKKAELLLDTFLDKYPKSIYIEWVAAKIKASSEIHDIKIQIEQNSESTMAYDTKFVDGGFKLLLDFLESIEH